MNLLWHNKETARFRLRDKRLHPFLFQKGSLTRLLQQRCKGYFNIELITESWRSPMPDERHLLSLRNNESTFIRETWLKCAEQKLVFARTVIPRKTLRGKSIKLTRLGTKPLGDILFNDNTAYRKNMRYAKIPVHCEPYIKTIENNSDINFDLWGRQSIFHIKNNPLLVIEVFLPAILECNKN